MASSAFTCTYTEEGGVHLPVLREYHPSITVYEAKHKVFIVSSSVAENRHLVLKITKDATRLIVHADAVVYTARQLDALLSDIAHAAERTGGLTKLGSFAGVLGVVQFSKGFYVLLASASRVVGNIGPHAVYEVTDTRLVYLGTEATTAEATSTGFFQKDDEARYRKLFGDFDMKRELFYSCSYDLSNTLQRNMLSRGGNLEINDMYVWNHNLLQPLLAQCREDVKLLEPYIIRLVHGSFSQGSVTGFGRRIVVILASRRSRFYAGTRFMKRGMNDAGHVANHVEVEQIAYDASSLAVGRCYGNFTSYVQIRGSVPAYWSQLMDHKKPKPAVRVGRHDKDYDGTRRHFHELLGSYGSPVIVLDLLQQSEKKKRERVLSDMFDGAILGLRSSLPPDAEILYWPWDLRRASRLHREKVVNDMAAVAEDAIVRTNFFHCDASTSRLQIQSGVVRTNCLDCLDRTNLAQLFVNKTVLAAQLKALGVIDSEAKLLHHSSIVDMLLFMHIRLGDSVAQQYAGSRAVSNGVLKRGMFEDLFINMKRFYHNHMTDTEKQRSINLALGLYGLCLPGFEGGGALFSLPLHPDYIDRLLSTKKPGEGPAMRQAPAMSPTSSPPPMPVVEVFPDFPSRVSNALTPTAGQRPTVSGLSSNSQSSCAPPTTGEETPHGRYIDIWDVDSDWYLHLNVSVASPAFQPSMDPDAWGHDAMERFQNANRRVPKTGSSVATGPQSKKPICALCSPSSRQPHSVIPTVPVDIELGLDNVTTSNLSDAAITGSVSGPSEGCTGTPQRMDSLSHFSTGKSQGLRLPSSTHHLSLETDDSSEKKLNVVIGERYEASSEYFDPDTPEQRIVRREVEGKGRPDTWLLNVVPMNLSKVDTEPTVSVPDSSRRIYERYVKSWEITDQTRKEFLEEVRASEHMQLLRKWRAHQFACHDKPRFEEHVLMGMNNVELWSVEDTTKNLAAVGVGAESVQCLRAAGIDGDGLKHLTEQSMTHLGISSYKDRKHIKEVVKRKKEENSAPATLETNTRYVEGMESELLSWAVGRYHEEQSQLSLNTPYDVIAEHPHHQPHRVHISPSPYDHICTLHERFAAHFTKYVPPALLEEVVVKVEQAMSCEGCGFRVMDRTRKTLGLSALMDNPLCELPELAGGEAMHSTILGSQAVSWVVDNAASLGLKLSTSAQESSRRSAVAFLDLLIQGGLLTQVSPESFQGEAQSARPKTMVDSRYVLYRLMRHESMYVLNLSRVATQSRSQHLGAPLQLAEFLVSLSTQVLRMYEELPASTERGGGPQVQELLRHPTYKQLRECVIELQFVDLTSLTSEERMCFFINVFNVLFVHGWVSVCTQRDIPFGVFMKRCAYVVSANLLSLADIKHGILRHNRFYGDSLLRPFTAADPRRRLCVEADPRVHFALVDLRLWGAIADSSAQESVEAPTNPALLSSNFHNRRCSTMPEDALSSSSDDEDTTQPKFALPIGARDGGMSDAQQAGQSFFRALWAPTTPSIKDRALLAHHHQKVYVPHQANQQLQDVTQSYLQQHVVVSPDSVVLPSVFAEYPDDFGACRDDWLLLCARYVHKSELRRIVKGHTTSIVRVMGGATT
eukprot:PhM_4_TR8436/c0_g2_i1/m.4152